MFDPTKISVNLPNPHLKRFPCLQITFFEELLSFLNNLMGILLISFEFH